MTKFRYLPQDLVKEILCRVPAKNLKRLRSTCKDWNHLFNNKTFVKKHFDKAGKEFLPLMLTSKFGLYHMSIDIQGDNVDLKNELSLFDPDFSNSYQFGISDVFHCDGLLLCTSEEPYRIFVWNPCTGQTKWIKAGIPRQRDRTFVLGYCQQSCVRSYKILSFCTIGSIDSMIYELSSDLWKTVDHDLAPGWSLSYSCHYVSLKGDTYMFAKDETATQISFSLLRFDFTTEKFVHVPFPCNLHFHVATSLSVVREDKLSVLLQFCDHRSDIWLTNQIEETKVVSWSKVLSLDLTGFGIQISRGATFLLDEEKKCVVLCEPWLEFDKTLSMDSVYIIREDNTGTPFDLGVYTHSDWPTILSYVPSLVQIEGGGRNKRKIGD